VAGASICGRNRIVITRRAGDDVDMASKSMQSPAPVRPYPTGLGVLLSTGDFDALMDELDSLRAALQDRRERVPAPADADVAINGGAGVGSIVEVADRAGRTTEYELVGRRDGAPERERVSLASATGKALLGARPGDRVRVTSANGRQRRVRVVNVKPALAAGLRASLG
jgi:transcription elongation GreA/GreB family factor